MSFRKSNLYLSLVNSYMIDSPQPSSINYWWNLGSLLGLCLVIQICTGIFLAMHYSSNIELAFSSVEHIMRDVQYGWLLRYMHANGASMFFICMYIHIGKGLYYGSYRSPRIVLWTVGVIIFILTMAAAFLGYCCVYGQMSHWGALVITNLFSAIPFIGQDIVLWLWGGFNKEDPHYSNIMLNKSVLCWNLFIWIINYYIIQLIIIINNNNIIWNKNNIASNTLKMWWGPMVKILIIRRKSAVINILSITYTYIGVILIMLITQRLNSRKLNTTIIYDKNHKLNTDDPIYAYIVGLFEGDGWITISKKGKYLLYELGIEMHIRDIKLLYKIKNILGVGKVSIKRIKNNDGNIKEICRFNVRNKNHLKNIIIPIFNKYPMLTNKYYDYLFFKDNLLKDIKYYNDLLNYSRCNKSLNNVEDILNKNYFCWWLIGFIEAEGSFNIYTIKNNNSKYASFELSQTNGLEILKAIKIYLKINQNIYTNKDNNSRITLKSIRGIENIVKFINKNPVKLLGYKRLQYLLFLKKLRLISKYKNHFNIPQNYK